VQSKNKDYKKPPGLPKARQTFFPGIKKSGYYRNTRPGKRKIKLSSFVAKQRYVFLSVPENIQKEKTFFEKIPYKRDPRSGW
jgi:hypothetical protein